MAVGVAWLGEFPPTKLTLDMAGQANRLCFRYGWSDFRFVVAPNFALFSISAGRGDSLYSLARILN